MISPQEEYNFNKNINNIKDIAYNTLFVKYLVENVKGYKKMTEIESTDQESLIATRNGGFPIPGMIYTFIYGEPDQVQLKFGAKNFIDVAPLVFCMNNAPDSFKGINMNMLPVTVRLDFLQSFYKTFKDFFERTAELLAQNDKLAWNKRFIEYVKSGKGKDMIRLFNSANGAHFQYGYRSYNIRKVKQLRMIEYNEWNYIPFYVPKDAFREINQSQMHKLYYRSK